MVPNEFGCVENPFGRGMISARVLAGMGELSVLVAAGAVVGQEAPIRMHGTVPGVFGLPGGANGHAEA